MQLHQIEYFMAVAKRLNFTQAAEDLQIAQPSLTRAIHKLETELGGPLFRRERKNTHLTELGRMVLPDLQASLSAVETARLRARGLKRNEVGSLALGVSSGLDTNDVVGMVLDVAAELKGLEVTVEVASRDTLSHRLMKGDLDAAILNGEHDAANRLNLLPIEADAWVIAFTRDHRFRESSVVEIDELESEPIATLVHDDGGAALSALAQEGRGSFWAQYRSNDPRWIAAFVRRGLGVSAMPARMAKSFGLCHRPLRGVASQPASMLATVAGRRHSRAVALIIQRLKTSETNGIAKPDKSRAAG